MNSTPLVSFVVPSYNYAHLLGQCVNSILAQDFENFEVLIMDNCSPDNTPEVARSFRDPRIKYFRNDSNLGAEQNFNEGLKRALGKYVWILSADDLLRSPRALGRCIEVMERSADVGFTFCRAIEGDGQTERGGIAWAYSGEENRTWDSSTFVSHLLESNCVPFSCVLLRRNCLDRVGMFPVDLPFAADWYLWIKLAMHYGVSYLAEPLVLSRVSQNSLTSQQSRAYARICVGDELSVLGRIVREAELLKKPDLADACRATLVRRSKSYLLAGLWGMAHCMNASQFEEILQGRLRDLIDPSQIRASVYRSLASDLSSFYNVPNSPITPDDEIAVFWDLWRHAECAQIASLRDACKLALAHRLACRMRLLHGNAALIGTEFAEMLQRHIPGQAIVKELRALIYRDLGDQQYNKDEYMAATQSYRRALEIYPFHARTLTKCLFLKTGHFGLWIRKSVHQVRELKNAIR